MVAQLKEEAMFLKNQLLAHGNCSCDVVKQYLQQNTKFADQPSNATFQPPQQQPQQQAQMLPPPPPPQQRPKQTGEDYFAPVHSTPTPSLPPLRATASTG